MENNSRKLFVSLVALACLQIGFAQGQKSIPVKLAAGKTVLLKSQFQGYKDVDFVMDLGAGQTLSVDLKASNGATYFNVIAPDSNTAMVNSNMLPKNQVERMVPTDGKYHVMVYMMRSDARRGAKSTFSIGFKVSGKALPALSGGSDALVKGTKFHATADVPFTHYLYSNLKTCKAGVTRRGHDGTATVEFQFKNEKRRVLFVKGKPVASDSTEPTSISTANGMRVLKIGTSETYQFPDEFLTGG